MQLSRLHLSGFKSFADETTLEFGAGITAVVGPNGSGKSNIVDALLWCLGERSNKALRGQSASDVIFAGTQTRRATGRAEVNLFFDNESGALPLPYKEVQVSRVLLRDGGKGEYTLCGAKCRLRDVVDLFLDTGVGPDTLCIISQGEIDAILSAKPEDRRGLIEGAAGIQKYHARRSETRKKLERVEADLTRVRDIVAELEAQLVPLEAQATLAREYDGLVARLRELQLAVLARDYALRAAKVAELRAKADESAGKVSEARGEIAQLELAEASGTERLRALEGEVEALSGRLTELVGAQKGAEGELAVARERAKSLGEIGEFAAREAGVLRVRLEGVQGEVAAAREALEEATREASALSGEAARAEARLGEATAKLSDATRALGALQARQLETLRAGQAMREAAASARARMENERGRLAELGVLTANLHAELLAARGGETAAQESLAALRAGAEAARAATEERRAAWQEAQAKARDSAQGLARTRENRSSLQARAKVLRELEQNLEGMQGGARGVLEAVRRGELPPDYLPVADAIRAQPRFETAIEIALGGSVHHLICPDDGAARKGVAFLKERRAGRATFLPLASLRASFLGERTLRLLGEPGVVGVASAAQLVSCKPEHDDAVGYLLNRFLVVETLEDALRLAPRCEAGARLVSLDGDLVLPAGAITGGAGKHRAGGLLARKRELDELGAALNGFEEQLTAQETALSDANAQVAATQEAWRAAQSAESEAGNHVARAEREVEGAAREVRRIKGQTEAVVGQARALEGQLSERVAHEANGEQAARDMEEAATRLEKEVARAAEVVAEQSGEREAVRDEVAGVREGWAQSGERLDALRRGLAELEKAARALEGQISAKDAQIERAQSENGGLANRVAALQERLETHGARRDELEGELNTARTGRGAALGQLEAVSAQLKTSREQLHTEEDELHRVEVRLAGVEAEVGDMERRLREEFGTEPDDANTAKGLPMEPGKERREIEQLRTRLDELGPVNMGAVAQYDAVKERLDFLTAQKNDLEGAASELEAIIAEIDGRMREQFLGTFRAVQGAFEDIFVRVMGGGATKLALTCPENLLETGIELRVQLPGKAAQDIGLLSGGERALTALAFMMALLKVRPSPFVVLDEVDAPLDQSNVGRFTELLREFTGTTQFIVITHNNGTMQAADVLYGVTQQEPGVSALMSVRLAEAGEMVRGEGAAPARTRRD